MIWFNSCRSSHPDARLEAVKGIVDESPELVRRKLDSINPRSLSVKDRHLHDLLKIKANDKCMVLHTSDSVILRLVEYYSSHRNEAELSGGALLCRTRLLRYGRLPPIN